MMARIQSLMRFVRKSPHFNFNFVVKKLVHSISMQNTNVSHLNSNSNSSITILINNISMNHSGYVNLFSLITNPNTNDRSVVKVDLPFINTSTYTNIYGHSHGIVCFSNRKNNIFLCNPTTKEFYQLPPSILLQTNQYCYPSFVGFGYDPESKDFKVVRFVTFRPITSKFYTLKVEIYDLSKDRWREIDNTTHHNYTTSDAVFGMCHKGLYYFMAVEGLNEINRHAMVSFDLSKERFREIPIPKEFKAHDYVTLGFCSGSSIVHLLDSWKKDLEAFNIWLIEKNESGGISWSKALTINPISTRKRPKLFVNSDEILMEAKHNQVVSYNVNTKEFKSLPFEWDESCSQYFVFEKSLLSVKGGSKHDLGDLY